MPGILRRPPCTISIPRSPGATPTSGVWDPPYLPRDCLGLGGAEVRVRLAVQRQQLAVTRGRVKVLPLAEGSGATVVGAVHGGGGLWRPVHTHGLSCLFIASVSCPSVPLHASPLYSCP